MLIFNINNKIILINADADRYNKCKILYQISYLINILKIIIRKYVTLIKTIIRIIK